MSNCYVVALPRNVLAEKTSSPFLKCRSFLMEITWMIDNWERSLRPYRLNQGIEPITEAEKALENVKNQIWDLCLYMSYGYEFQNRQDLTNARRMRNTNTEVLVRENTNLPVAVHQRESTKTVIVSNSPHQQPMKNLLVDWSVSINSQFRLSVVGSLPNDGSWETSAVTARVGPTTVKTVSGTVYNLHGPMVMNEDADIPEFVQEKFHYGFPEDWEEVANKWISILKRKENPMNSGPRNNRPNVEQVPHLLLQDIQNEAVSNRNKVTKQRKEFPIPASKESMRRQLPEETPTTTAALMKKRTPNPKLDTQEKMSRTEKVEDKSRKKVEVPLPRYSKRILSKSLLDSSCVSMVEPDADLDSSEDGVKYLKEWFVEYSRNYNGLIMRGTLINEEGTTLAEKYSTKAVCRRIRADLVETVDGQHYRLIGSSAFIFSDVKDFDFGFPANLQKLVEKFRCIRGNTFVGHQLRKSSFAHPSNSTENTRNVSGSSMASSQVKKRSNMITQVLKHQLSKVHTSVAEEKNSGAYLTRSASMDGKRKADSISFTSGNVAPIKKKKGSVSGAAQATTKDQNDSLVDESIGERHWKQKLIKTMQNDGNEKLGPKKPPTVVQNTESGTANKPTKNPAKPIKPVGKEGADKYALGLATDDCESDYDFNIF